MKGEDNKWDGKKRRKKKKEKKRKSSLDGGPSQGWVSAGVSGTWRKNELVVGG